MKFKKEIKKKKKKKKRKKKKNPEIQKYLDQSFSLSSLLNATICCFFLKNQL